MKWFESPQYNKIVEKTHDRIEPRVKFDSKESSNDSFSELKPFRKYREAADMTPGLYTFTLIAL